VSAFEIMAVKMIGEKQVALTDFYTVAVERKASAIVTDSSHPLHSSFNVLPSGRRYKVPLVKKATYKKTFIPTAIDILNRK